MILHGLQKMTLLDYPGKVACTVFTGGCNFLCPFCHNAFLVADLENAETYSEEDIISFLKKRTGLLEGVCITGGEPLLHSDTEKFAKKIKNLGFSVKLDTNGSFPERLKSMVNNGLADYVAMDIKNSKEKYAITAGSENLNISDIEQSVDFLENCGVEYEFRTTIVKEFHTTENVESIAEWIGKKPHYFLQNFVDSGNLICDDSHPVEKEVLEEMKKRARIYTPLTELRGV